MKQMYSNNLSAKDNIVIPNYVAGFQNGIDVPEEFMNKAVYVGHPVYKEEGKFSLVPVTEDEYQAVEGAEYVGVLKSSLKTDEHFNRTLAVMDMGVIETEAMDIKYSDALLKELKSNLKIVFR